jgi:hypothetical protein
LERTSTDASTIELEDDPRWQAVVRITNDGEFVRASRLCQFLRYVCERAITERVNEITEQQIGVHVFGRPSSYNPSDDTIVRATARQLRQRLAVYYQESGSHETLRISIPRGGYVPFFLSAEAEKAPESTVSSSPNSLQVVASIGPVSEPRPLGVGRQSVETFEVIAPAKTRARYSVPFAWGIAAGLVIAACLYGSAYLLNRRPSPSQPLWTELFQTSRPTLIVSGDAGLNIFENLARHEVSLDEYTSHSYLDSSFAKTPGGYSWDPLAIRSYTTMQNSRLSSRLLALHQDNRKLTELLFARDLNMGQLKDSNIIMLGAPQYDPWEHLFEQNLNFTVHYDGVANTITVLNRNPRNGEQPVYTWSPSNPHHGFALITLTNNLSGSGRALLVQGITAAGDDAAGDFLLDDRGIATELAHLKEGSGHVRNFQILLETLTTGGSSEGYRVIAER